MEEKRRVLRFKLEVPAWFKNTKYKNKDLSIASTMNVSATGIALITREALEVGQQVLMQVKLPPDERVIVRAEVVWVRDITRTFIPEYQVGLRLVEPMQYEESKFVKFCAKKMLEFYNQEHPSP